MADSQIVPDSVLFYPDMRMAVAVSVVKHTSTYGRDDADEQMSVVSVVA